MQMELEQPFYWHLTLWDGEIIKVKPENAANVQHRLDNKLDVKTPNRTIIYKNIKDFVESGEPYIDQKLLEESASAFGEPIYTTIEDNGRKYDAIKAAWVKKSIPRREWTKTYMHIPSYKLLNDNDSHVEVAFVLAVHDIDPHKVTRVTGHELARLER